MRCRILHESPGRLRVRMIQPRMSMDQADHLQYYLLGIDEVTRAKVNERSCDAIIHFTSSKDVIVEALSQYGYDRFEVSLPDHTSRKTTREYQDKLFYLVARRLFTRFILPTSITTPLTIVKSLPYIYQGVRSLMHRKIEVSVLDATSMSVSMLTGDFTTAGSIIFLLKIGDLLEEWTHKKSVGDLAQRMYLNVDKVWLKDGQQELLVDSDEIQVGDTIVVHHGNLIPFDGVVAQGEIMVNQASMTGESVAVHKDVGAIVYAGTVVEQGNAEITVKQASGTSRYDRIVHMIEDSEKLKSETENRASHLADALVPYSLVGTALAWFFTRNVNKALSILMVDYSCALKLAIPISILSGMRECSDYHIDVKGGKYLENVARAKTIVFDKTGTLTHATPSVYDVIPFNHQDRTEVLRIAACLEEHFPHSMANAVVQQAKNEGIDHKEMHSKVEYIVAHGIKSTIDEKSAIIGSYHFVFEDEKVQILEEDQERFDALPSDCSLLYLAIDGTLEGVIAIQDPIRKEAKATIRKLHDLGFDKIVMLTGDSYKVADTVAKELGMDEYVAEVLPEDKANFIEKEHELGRKVIMIGDGINDSPALSKADAGIAIASGAAIAREIADITISANDLDVLVTLREISLALMHRVDTNYRSIMGFNSALIALGFFGILAPSTTALLHNTSTIYISLQSMRDLI